MKNVSICRYHLEMFNRFRMFILSLFAFPAIILFISIFIFGSTIFGGKDYAIAFVGFFVVLFISFRRLSYHAKAFEEHIGVDISKELMAFTEKTSIRTIRVQRCWMYLFDYYTLANKSCERYEDIQESA